MPLRMRRNSSSHFLSSRFYEQRKPGKFLTSPYTLYGEHAIDPSNVILRHTQSHILCPVDTIDLHLW